MLFVRYQEHLFHSSLSAFPCSVYFIYCSSCPRCLVWFSDLLGLMVTVFLRTCLLLWLLSSLLLARHSNFNNAEGSVYKALLPCAALCCVEPTTSSAAREYCLVIHSFYLGLQTYSRRRPETELTKHENALELILCKGGNETE